MNTSESLRPPSPDDNNNDNVDKVLVVVDHVPEAVKESLSSNCNNPRQTTATPETISLLTDTDESMMEQQQQQQQVTAPSDAAINLSATLTTKATIKTSSSLLIKGKIRPWCRQKHYSDLVQEGLEWLATANESNNSHHNSDHHPKDNNNNNNNVVVMVFESPSTADPNSGSSFYNDTLFQFYDYPLSTNEVKSILAPLRYSAMTGDALLTYLQSPPPAGLTDHWAKTIPNVAIPRFCHTIPSDATVCAYLPLEQFKNHHLIDPQLHYEIAGKDDIPHMTTLTTNLLPDMKEKRPCIVKMTHCMGSKGIFVIRNDDDEQECLQYMKETGHPAYVATDFVDIERNLAAHFFIHPSGDSIWFGASENLLDKDGVWSADATIHNTATQEQLQELLSPYVQDVVQYCIRRGYWGACGIDVLMERNGRGYVVDVNPRVTGTCPAVMVFQRLAAMDPTRLCVGTFRRSKKYIYPGSMQDLFQHVQDYNQAHGDTRIVIFSALERDPQCTYLNIGVFGVTQVRCVKVLNKFAMKQQQV